MLDRAMSMRRWSDLLHSVWQHEQYLCDQLDYRSGYCRELEHAELRSEQQLFPGYSCDRYSGLTTDQTVTVTVTDTNEAPPTSRSVRHQRA